MLDKTYRPGEVETRLYERWERSGAFAAHPDSNARPYAIVMPPPNVTGSLHHGHALTFTLQDILIRYHRMKGRDALWQPGTDHAGIATQMVVERQLAAEGKTRHDLGRERFVARVWQWREESGGTITRQLRRLGCSPDWSRERFTMDEGLSAAVRKVFVELHRRGLIYRDKRLVNWDPQLHTAISDLEVEQREVKGQIWYLRYPIEGEPGRFIVVATTRPETMLGDTAVAVHPDDERFRALVGKMARLPLADRLIPILADEHSDPAKGSGAVKITPAHDFNDFAVGQRHKLPMVNVFDRDARMNENAPERFRGLDRTVARERVVAELEALGLVEKIEPQAMTLPYGDRSGVVIEPWLTDQWYVDAATLAKPAIEAVEHGRTRFVPKQWENTFFEWMRNIQPWCVSRQIWWGHQIPAWYAPDGSIFVALDEAGARAQAEKKLGAVVALTRDPDVLDTWFSSALWPFSTLGWPDQTQALARYYPTDVLVTGFDIIFFWVARMQMMGHAFMDDVPFREVHIHGIVRDERGQKMSKSKGNTADPLDLIDRYGCDALRFTLAALASHGRDIKLTEGRIEGYRNFATKLWNAARFCEINECRPVPGFDPGAARDTVNRWIVGALVALVGSLDEALAAYRFNDAAAGLYAFVWNTFCDWYVEFAKPILAGPDGPARAETRATAAWAFENVLKLLHPIMPFVTEELWGQTGKREGMLIAARWPDFAAGPRVDAGAVREMEWVVRLISEIRAVRAELNVPAGVRVPVLLAGAEAEVLARIERHRDQVLVLARAASLAAVASVPPAGCVAISIEGATVALSLAGLVDLAEERKRLTREIARLAGEIDKIERKLGNADFLAKAKPEVIEEQRERRDEGEAARAKLSDALRRLAGA